MNELERWHAQVIEEIIDPERPIFDPHHHLWRADMPYEIGDLWADTQTGHNIVGTVFIECGAEYRTEGPRHLSSHSGQAVKLESCCLPLKRNFVVPLSATPA